MAIVASDWAAISPVNNVAPVTIASASIISPTSFLTVLTGNVAVDTINPPVPHGHMLAIEFAGTAGVSAAGNVKTVKASVVGMVMLLVYNPNTQKYIPV